MCQGQTALAEEITQQVFEAACRGITQFRAEASAKTWLFAIAHHQTLRALARQRRQCAIQQLLPQTPQARVEQSRTLEDDVPTHDDVARLRMVLTQAALTPIDRSIVLLRFGIDMPQALSVAEIATVLGLSRDMVYRRLKHTLAQLRRIMDQDLPPQGRLARCSLAGDGAVRPRGSGRVSLGNVTCRHEGDARGARAGHTVRPGAAFSSGRARHSLGSLL
jgi:RNA polymerase sigma-70 factor (ECF subfamily)